MILPGVTLTPALAAWLRAAHDDGQPDLDVRTGIGRVTPSPVEALRRDGTELSPTEQLEVRAILAAHKAEPLKIAADPT